MISIIVVYKNRDLTRVKNFLKSLSLQTFKDFEVVFVDHGSDDHFKKDISELCLQYSFVNYIYSHNQGMMFNKSHALNIAIKNTQYEIIMSADIDFLYPYFFFEKLAAKVKQVDLSKQAFNYRSYFLPKNYEPVDDLFKGKFKSTRFKKVLLSADYNHSFIVVKKSVLLDIKGYNELFRIWGAEDDDVYDRIKQQGVEFSYLDHKEIYCFHQWHPRSAFGVNMPIGWRETGRSYRGKKLDFLKGDNWGEKTNLEDRKILKSGLNKVEVGAGHCPQEALFTLQKKFKELNSDSYIHFSYEDKEMSQEPLSLKMKIYLWYNRTIVRFGHRLKWNYQLVRFGHNVGSTYGVNDYWSLIFYFLLYNSDNLDYRYEISEKKLDIYLTKI